MAKMTQKEVDDWAEYGMQAHARESELRRAVRAMTAALNGREWAEHVSRDPDATALEAEITVLVGRVNAGVPASDGGPAQ